MSSTLPAARTKSRNILTAELAKQGLICAMLCCPGTTDDRADGERRVNSRMQVRAKELPRDKREIIDALLLSFQVPFGVAENFSVELRDGLRVDTRIDRLFELEGKRTAILFRRTEPLIRQALQENHGTKVCRARD